MKHSLILYIMGLGGSFCCVFAELLFAWFCFVIVFQAFLRSNLHGFKFASIVSNYVCFWFTCRKSEGLFLSQQRRMEPLNIVIG